MLGDGSEQGAEMNTKKLSPEAEGRAECRRHSAQREGLGGFGAQCPLPREKRLLARELC